MTKIRLSKKLINKISTTIDVGLVSGLGKPTPGQMCVEAAVCYALDLPHNDDPKCVHEAIRQLKIRLNDACWSSNEVRAKGLKRLAILQLNTKDNFNASDFLIRLETKFSKYAYADAAVNAATYAAATYAAVDAYAYVAAAAVDAYAAAATYAATYAYVVDADAAAADAILFAFASGVEQILIDMEVPAVKYLSLLD